LTSETGTVQSFCGKKISNNSEMVKYFPKDEAGAAVAIPDRDLKIEGKYRRAPLADNPSG